MRQLWLRCERDCARGCLRLLRCEDVRLLCRADLCVRFAATADPLLQLPPDLQPVAAESTTEGLLVRWAEPGPEAPAEGAAAAAEHVSLYPWSWLRQHSYAPVLSSLSSSALPDGPADSRGRILWGSGIGAAPPTVTHDEVQEDRGVARWCAKIVSQSGE